MNLVVIEAPTSGHVPSLYSLNIPVGVQSSFLGVGDQISRELAKQMGGGIVDRRDSPMQPFRRSERRLHLAYRKRM